jgi:hypothetical protein
MATSVESPPRALFADKIVVISQSQELDIVDDEAAMYYRMEVGGSGR